MPALLNVNADQKATLAQQQSDDIPGAKKPFLAQGVIGYYTQEGTEILNLSEYITTQLHSASMHQYLEEKFQWTKEIQSYIEWQPLASALRAFPVPQRLKQLQYLYNWQHVGQQKVLFAQSATTTTTTRSAESLEDLHQCPMQCGAPENHGHYLLCTSPPATVARHTNIETLRNQLTEANTCPGLITWLGLALQGKESAISVDTGSSSYFDILGKVLIEEQNALGWDAMRRGFFSRQWRRIQAAYAHHELQRAHFDLDQWMLMIIKFIFQHGRAMWEVRNASVHGTNPNDSRSLRLRLLRKRVRQLYNHEDRRYIPHVDRKTYFGLPVLQRCKQGLYALTSWIQFLERRLHFHREEAMKRTIHAWLEKS